MNSSANPHRGQVIVIYATGEGQTTPPGVDGRIQFDVTSAPAGRLRGYDRRPECGGELLRDGAVRSQRRAANQRRGASGSRRQCTGELLDRRSVVAAGNNGRAEVGGSRLGRSASLRRSRFFRLLFLPAG